MAESCKLRVGIMHDDVRGPQHLVDFIRWCLSQGNIELAQLIIHGQCLGAAVSRDRYPRLTGWRDLRKQTSELAFRMLTSLEQKALRRHSRYRTHECSHDISGWFSSVTQLSSPPPHNGTDNIEQLVDLDLIIDFSSALSGHEIRVAPRLGVISIRYGNDTLDGGSSPGFWEVYYRSETTGFTICRAADGARGRVTLRRGHIPTKHFYKLNQAAIYERACCHLKRLVGEIAAKKCLPPALPSVPHSGPPPHDPTAIQCLRYLLYQGRRKALHLADKLLRRDYRWSVGYVRSGWSESVLWRRIEIKNPPGRFLADPFVVSRDGRDYCFVEEYSDSTRLGSIAVYELTPTGGVRTGTALDEPFHLSFPFLFEFEGELFMCPETHEQKDIRIYRCVEFPLQWTLETTLMTNISAADSMLLEWDGKWWLLTNVDPLGRGEHTSELWIFHSDSPLAGDWIAHERNPVLFDASCARNAGLIRRGDDVYRVGQGQGFNLYGKRTSINRIVKLTSDSYVECSVGTILPEFVPGVVGTHHLHSNGGITVFDYVRRAFVGR
jgi:hypothetical protein